LVKDSYLLKLLLVVFGFGSQTFICGFNRQNICSARSHTRLTVQMSHGNTFIIIKIVNTTAKRIFPRFVMCALPSIYTKIYLIFFLALHAEFRVRVLRTVDFNLAKVIQDFFKAMKLS
jgi:hypothetical protein